MPHLWNRRVHRVPFRKVAPVTRFVASGDFSSTGSMTVGTEPAAPGDAPAVRAAPSHSRTMATPHMWSRRPPRIAAAMFVAGLTLACATFASSPSSELVNRDWRLLALRGQRIIPGTGMRETFIRLSGDSLRMSGWGGCNRIGGTATADDQHLTFGPVLATRMACADARLNRQETEFLTALQATTLYRLLGDTLILSRDEEELARLTAPAR